MQREISITTMKNGSGDYPFVGRLGWDSQVTRIPTDAHDTDYATAGVTREAAFEGVRAAMVARRPMLDNPSVLWWHVNGVTGQRVGGLALLGQD